MAREVIVRTSCAMSCGMHAGYVVDYWFGKMCSV